MRKTGKYSTCQPESLVFFNPKRGLGMSHTLTWGVAVKKARLAIGFLRSTVSIHSKGPPGSTISYEHKARMSSVQEQTVSTRTAALFQKGQLQHKTVSNYLSLLMTTECTLHRGREAHSTSLGKSTPHTTVPFHFFHFDPKMTFLVFCFCFCFVFLKTSQKKHNLVPRAFSSFKMAVGETPGQGC